MTEEENIRAEMKKLVEEGKLSANTPFEGMNDEWTEEQNYNFKRALAKMFGWKINEESGS